MSDWLSALRAAPSPLSDLLDFAATQPSLAATWRNAIRGDWVIWLAANGFAGVSSPWDILNATVILADYARPPTWHLMLHVRADDEDVLRRLAAVAVDFDLTQIVAYVYLGCTLGGLAGTVTYFQLPGHSVFVRQLLGSFVLLVAATLTAFVAYRMFARSVKRAAAATLPETAVPMALAVATRVSLRSDVMKQVEGARIMRRRLNGPPA